MSIVNDQFTILILIQFCRPNYYTIIFLIPTIIISKNYIVYLNTYYVPPLGEYHMKQKRTEIFLHMGYLYYDLYGGYTRFLYRHNIKFMSV